MGTNQYGIKPSDDTTVVPDLFAAFADLLSRVATTPMAYTVVNETGTVGRTI